MTKAQELCIRISDAQDKMAQAKSLNEAIFMAAADIRDTDQRDALQTVSDIIDTFLSEVREMLDAVREDME
jgi:vacuolar-type H+-ATPase subunit E/Vma4